MEDNELMIQVRAGNKEAYEQLIKKYMSQAKSFACQYVHDTYAAEDIVQESFVDLYMQRFDFDERYQFSTYLFSIVKNKSRTYLKKNREVTMSNFGEEAEEQILAQNLVNSDTPETTYFKKLEFTELRDVIHDLKEEEQNLLYLYAVEECSYKEIAAKLGQTVMQIKIKLYRARKKIRERRMKTYGR